ncbi:MAG: preprotein translocase subunit YajC [Nitrospira sp.]
MSLFESVAWAQGVGGGGGGTPSALISFVPFVLIFALFYFLLILPQQKKQKQQKIMMDALKKGDKIVTSSGIWGTVTNLGKDTVTLQIADNTKIKIQREYITRLRSDEEEQQQS